MVFEINLKYMHPKNYLQVIIRHKFTIVASIVLCGLAALIYSYVKSQAFSSNVSMSFHRVNKEATADYQYDNYYAGKAVEIVSNTVVGWLQTPNVVQEIYTEAKVVPDDIYKDTKKFKPKQVSAHQVEMRLVNKNRQDLEKLSKATVAVMKNKVASLEVTNEQKNAFDVIIDEPIITEIKYSPWMLTLIGLVAGLFVGIGLAFLWEYFKSEE